MDEETTNAEQLATWLDSPEGTDPPAGLDPDVAGAVWALRPDRAPSPRVSLDDIFAAVESGPFAERAALEGSSGAPRGGLRVVEGGRSEEPAAPVEGLPARRSPARFWMTPAFGIGIAAAAAALFGFPIASKLGKPDMAALEEARQEAAAPAAAAPAGPGLAEMTAQEKSTLAEAEDPNTGVAAAAPAAAPSAVPAATMTPSVDAPAPAARPQLGAGGGLSAADASGNEFKATGGLAQAPLPQEQAEGRLDDAVGDEWGRAGAVAAAQDASDGDFDRERRATAAPAGGAAAPKATQSKRDVSEEAPVVSGTTRSTRTVAPSAGAPVYPDSAGRGAPNAPAARSSDAPTVDLGVKEAAPPPAENSWIPEATEAAKKAEAKPLDEEMAASEPADAGGYLAEAEDDRPAETTSSAVRRESAKASRPATEASKPGKLKSGSAQQKDIASAVAASSLDYRGDWYRDLPDVAPAFDAARALEGAGRWEEAVNAWLALANDARPEVAQDAALRAAKGLRVLGRLDQALSTVDAGLRRSSANTAFRSSLLVLRAELANAIGATGESKPALDEAEELDEAR